MIDEVARSEHHQRITFQSGGGATVSENAAKNYTSFAVDNIVL